MHTPDSSQFSPQNGQINHSSPTGQNGVNGQIGQSTPNSADSRDSRRGSEEDKAEKSKILERLSIGDSPLDASPSPYREPGNGKTWLEQVLKMTTKPIGTRNRATNRGALIMLDNNNKTGTIKAQVLDDRNNVHTNTITNANNISPLPESKTVKNSTDLTSTDFLPPVRTYVSRVRAPPPPAPPLLPFINGMTKIEKHTVQKLIQELRKYVRTFCGEVSEPDGWKKYVKYNRATNDDEFFPDVSTAAYVSSFYDDYRRPSIVLPSCYSFSPYIFFLFSSLLFSVIFTASEK